MLKELFFFVIFEMFHQDVHIVYFILQVNVCLYVTVSRLGSLLFSSKSFFSSCHLLCGNVKIILYRTVRT